MENYTQKHTNSCCHCLKSGNLSEIVYLLKYGTVQTQPDPGTQALYHLTTGPSTLLLSFNGEKGGKHT